LVILRYTTPTNLQEQKEKFILAEGKYIPEFTYEALPFSPEDLKDELKGIEIPDIPLGHLFKRKKQEIFEKLAFFEAFEKQDTSSMELYSGKIFGDITPENVLFSKQVLEEKQEIVPEEELLDFAEMEAFVKRFNYIYGIKTRFIEGNLPARFTMKGDELIVREGVQIGKRELRSIVAHEVEGHYLRKLNGREQVLSIFSRGTANYTETEEGIAIYNQSRFIGPKDRKFYSIYERYFFLEYARKHSYRRLLTKLLEYYNHDYEKVFTYILRLKRGWKNITKSGVFMKDTVYVNGFLKIEDFLNAGGNLEDLYIGKVAIEDLDEIQSSFLVPKPKDIKIPFSL